MNRVFNGFDLEIVPLKTYAHSSMPVDFEMLLEGYKSDFEDDAKRCLTDVDYHNYEQAYRVFFIARLNILAIQDNDTGMAFLEYQYDRYYSNGQQGFLDLILSLQVGHYRYLYNEAMECVARFLIKHDPRKRGIEATELQKFYALWQTVERARKGEEISELEMVRLFLFVVNNHFYCDAERNVRNNTTIGKAVIGQYNIFSEEMRVKLDNHITTWKSIDKVESFKK